MNTIKLLNDYGVFVFIQTVVVPLALFLTLHQLREARRSFQATVVSQISERSAALQWEAIKDPDLQSLLGIQGEKATPEQKRALVIGLVVNHYAMIYDLWRLGGIPNKIWVTFERDLRDAISGADFSSRWQQLKQNHEADFVALIDKLMRQHDVRRTTQAEPAIK